MMKTVAIIVGSTPMNTIRYAEALRIGVGQILCDHRVSIYLIGNGAWNALDLQPQRIGRPDIRESLALLGPCKISLLVDKESLEGKSASFNGSRLNPHVESISRNELWDRIAKSDVIMAF